jgi:hypothetical protein
MEKAPSNRRKLTYHPLRHDTKRQSLRRRLDDVIERDEANYDTFFDYCQSRPIPDASKCIQRLINLIDDQVIELLESRKRLVRKFRIAFGPTSLSIIYQTEVVLFYSCALDEWIKGIPQGTEHYYKHSDNTPIEGLTRESVTNAVLQHFTTQNCRSAFSFGAYVIEF